MLGSSSPSALGSGLGVVSCSQEMGGGGGGAAGAGALPLAPQMTFYPELDGCSRQRVGRPWLHGRSPWLCQPGQREGEERQAGGPGLGGVWETKEAGKQL